MPNYTFELRDEEGGAGDPIGVRLANRHQALQYARSVIHELMHGRELETRTWRLDVVENDGECIFEIPFASVDATLDHLSPKMRSAVENLCERRRALAEAVHDVTATVRESRALIARSRGDLYVAAEFGESVIRDRQ